MAGRLTLAGLRLAAASFVRMRSLAMTLRTLLFAGLGLACVAGLAAGVASCSLVDDGPGPIVPDSTLFIVGVLEASPDTVVHHAQVFVGTLHDPEQRYYDIHADPEVNLGRELFLPDLWAQVMVKAQMLDIRPMGTSEARVSVTGPLGTPTEATVVFVHESRGVYGDAAGALPRIPGARYRLDVEMPDGRHYVSETTTPQPYQIEVPDVLRPESHYNYHGPGNWTEISDTVRLPCTGDPDPYASVSIWSASMHHQLDSESLLEPDWRRLWFSDRGDHLRASTFFSIVTPSAFEGGLSCSVVWTTDSNTSRWDRSPLFIRLVQLSPELSRTYESPFREFTTQARPDDIRFDDPWYDDVLIARVEANDSRDKTYLPRVSNIDIVGAGGTRSKATDAVGVFGGMTARYITTWIEPVRSFDPDTLSWTYHPEHP